MSEEYTPLQRAIVKSKITNKSYFIYLEDYDDIEFGVKNSVGELKLYLIVPIKYIQDNIKREETVNLIGYIGFGDLYRYIFRNIREITILNKNELTSLFSNKFILDDEWSCNTELRFICSIDSLKIKT